MVYKTFRAAVIAAIIRCALTMPVLERRDGAINVDLAKISDTKITATLTNTADQTLSLLKYGSFFDEDAVQKVAVLKDGTTVPFTGIMKTYLLSDLPAEAFTTLAPGETYTTTINLPALHAMEDGGDFDVLTEGAIAYASPNSTKLTGAASFASNKLSLSMTSEIAKSVKSLTPPSRRKDKRTTIQNCSGSQATALRNALTNSVSLSNAAASAATSGSSSKFNEYFRSTSSSTRSTVAARFSGVARESGSTTGGSTTYSCTDDYSACSSGVLAYTYPSLNHIANCPLYYSALPALTRTCHAQDQATTTLHEFTHAPGTYSPGTDDNAYGYSSSVALSSSAAVLNADSYALYANAIYVGC